MDFFHALDVTRLTLVGEGGEASFLIGIPLSCLGAQLTLSDGKDRLQFTVALVGVHVYIVKLVIFLLQLASTSLLEDTGSFSNRIVIHELWLAGNSVLEVVFEATELGLVKNLSLLVFHTLKLLHKFDFTLSPKVLETAILLRRLLADSIVVDQFIALN